MLENKRLTGIVKFYSILDDLERRLIHKSTLSTCTGRDNWPQRGIYFFFELGQMRCESGTGLRVMRVGTHALKKDAKTTLWKRLSQHKGYAKSGGGNHRGSIFRLLVGSAIINKQNLDYSTWADGSSAPKEIRENEITLEKLVSKTIGQMPFLYLSISDEPGPDSLRGYIERNSIALLSNYNKPPLDPPAENWLGYKCSRERVYNSGLWNQNHVNEDYDSDFFYTLEEMVHKMEG